MQKLASLVANHSHCPGIANSFGAWRRRR